MVANSITIVEYAPHILIMRWQVNAQPADVLIAFQEIKHCLDQAEHENISIIIDILANPNIPLKTLFEAHDIQHHPNFREWLVLGQSETTQTHHHIRWFSSLDDLNQYLPYFAPSQFVIELTQFSALPN